MRVFFSEEARARQRESRRRNDELRRQRRIEAGELVSNEPYRERLQWLLEFDLPPGMVTVCERLATQGFTEFGRDTSYLQRRLGMRRHVSGHHGPNGKTYDMTTEWISRELGQALYVALEMDPLWDAGERAPIGERRFRRSELCGAHKCPNPPGHGTFGRMCEEHAQFFADLREREFSKRGWQNRKGRKREKAVTRHGDELQALLEEENAAA